MPARNPRARCVDPLAAIGVSQGGQAACAAAETRRSVRRRPRVSSEPPACRRPQTSAHRVGRPTESRCSATDLLPMLLDGLRGLASRPGCQCLHPRSARRQPDVIRSCTGPSRRAQAVGRVLNLTRRTRCPRSDEDVERMREWLTADALPQQPASGPLLVVVAGRDNLIRPDWTTAAVGRACGQGGRRRTALSPDDVHADAKALPGAIEWSRTGSPGSPRAPRAWGRHHGEPARLTAIVVAVAVSLTYVAMRTRRVLTTPAERAVHDTTAHRVAGRTSAARGPRRDVGAGRRRRICGC